MVYSSRFSYKCGKQFPVSRNIKLLLTSLEEAYFTDWESSQ